MSRTDALMDAYMVRLRDLAQDEDSIGRFFLFLDDELRDLEETLCESAAATEFYDRLIDQFRAWRVEMGEAEWQKVLTYNESLNGANQNDLLHEV